ncbi:MAG: PEGA domain-containing protein [Methanomicrobiales archaeon]|nr:PEGA domain-containing protein [Methanomicrobiales archaeon]
MAMKTSWGRAVWAVAGLLLCTGLLLPVSADTQLVESWAWTYGGAMCDLGASVRETADGGFIVAGSTNSFGRGDFDVYLLRIGPTGMLLWEQNLGTRADEFGADVRETGDGGFIVTGWSWSPASSTDVYLVRTDDAGRKLWERSYGGTGSDYGHAVLPLDDGGYAIAGSTGSFGPSVDMYLVRTGEDGRRLWEKTYGGAGDDAGFSLLSADNGDFVIAGTTGSFGPSSDVFLVRTGSNGTVLWEQHFGGPGIQEGRAVARAGDGGFVIAGGTDPLLSGHWDAYVVRTDSHGRLQWERAIGGGGSEYGAAVAMTGDDGFYLAGRTSSVGPSTDISLVRGSSLGTPLWERTFGGARYDSASSIQGTSDGGVVIAGTTDSFGRGDDVYLIRLAPLSGTLVVTSTPPGASLFIDGVARGVTPVSLGNVSQGRHTILLRYPGFEEYRAVTLVESGASPAVVDAMLVTVTETLPVPETLPVTVTPTPTPVPVAGNLFPAFLRVGYREGGTGSLVPFRLPDLAHLLSFF